MTVEAGRELDVLIAEKVMGLAPCVFKPTAQWSGWATGWSCQHQSSVSCYPSNADAIDHPHSILRRYSADISAAWQVVDNLRGRGWIVDVTSNVPEAARQYAWSVDIVIYGKDPDPWGCGETAPLAICRAALAAVEIDTA